MSSDIKTHGVGAQEKTFSRRKKMSMLSEIFSNPINLCLLGVCFFLLYKILKTDAADDGSQEELPPMPKRDFTLEELRKFDGERDKRILIGVNGKVFDVSKGRRFYGPGNGYNVMAGRDATRSFGKFDTSDHLFKDSYDDVSDLSSEEMDAVKHWEKTFEEKYTYVGKLLKPGEEHTNYNQADKEL